MARIHGYTKPDDLRDLTAYQFDALLEQVASFTNATLQPMSVRAI